MTDFWAQLARAPLREPLQIATDPDGVDVFLSREQWEKHILVEHAGMENYRHLIFRALTHPDDREWSEPLDRIPYTVRYHLYLRRAYASSRVTHKLRVVVKYLYPAARQGRLTGLVSTAYRMRWRGI